MIEKLLQMPNISAPQQSSFSNKADLAGGAPSAEVLSDAESLGLPIVITDARTERGVDALRTAIIKIVQDDTEPDRPIASDLAHAGDTVVLVTPIDSGAPKGRLILPQVQAIRELLDAHAKVVVVQQDRVAEAINELKVNPAFVMTDSQAIDDVAAQTPDNIPLTTFSLQMAYAKSDLIELARGAAALSHLKDGDKVLICETCKPSSAER